MTLKQRGLRLKILAAVGIAGARGNLRMRTAGTCQTGAMMTGMLVVGMIVAGRNGVGKHVTGMLHPGGRPRFWRRQTPVLMSHSNQMSGNKLDLQPETISSDRAGDGGMLLTRRGDEERTVPVTVTMSVTVAISESMTAAEITSGRK